MFPHYGSDCRVFAIEPYRKFLARARKRARVARAKTSLQVGSALDLPFGSASFDAVVIASVLCSVPSVSRTLSEVACVLRPGGQLRTILTVTFSSSVVVIAQRIFGSGSAKGQARSL